MLDRRFVVENAELVHQNNSNRGVKADVHRLVELEKQRRARLLEVEELNRRKNEIAANIKKAKTQDERQPLIDEGRKVRERQDAAQAEHDELDRQVLDLLRVVPNLTHPEAPVGPGEEANREVRRGKHQPPQFTFKPLDHVELAEKHDLIDFESGAQVAGHGFYFLKNEAVLLELALQKYALDLLIAEGFTPVITPDLARDEVLQGVGFIPRGEATQIYSIENTDLNLVATAEITLGGMHAGKVLDAEKLPLLYCGVSHCFRTEAGAAGRASRGIYRVHQFTKVEMFAFTRPEESDATLERICALECRVFDGLGIPYRVVDTATGDLGGPAYRKYDLEAWMPGRGEGGEWGEVTSTSNCTDYQARRLDIRYKNKGEKGTHFVHTLNGTAVAISRALIAILENYQEEDGSIRIPEVLQPWVGKARIGGK